MWIKPGQHGTSAQVPHPPHPQAQDRRLQVRPQHGLAKLIARHARYGPGDPWKNGP